MITIKRGTTNQFVIALTDEQGGAYKLSAGDSLIFGVKKSVRAENCCITKTVNTYDDAQGGYVVNLVPEDTQDLKCEDYVYDVGLQKATGEFYIVCSCDIFNIEDTVTEKM